jgi:hypothetical protein
LYVRAGDGVCKSVQSGLAKVKVPTDGDVDGQLAYLSQVVKLQQDGLSSFAKIGKPPKANDQDFLAGIGEDQAALKGVLVAAQTALDAGDQGTAGELLTDANDRSRKLRDKYRAFGFLVCGHSAADTTTAPDSTVVVDTVVGDTVVGDTVVVDGTLAVETELSDTTVPSETTVFSDTTVPSETTVLSETTVPSETTSN